MDRHYIKNPDGTDQRDKDGNRTFWSDSDGDWDPDHHQTVYHETPSGNKEDKHVHYDPKKGEFHKK
jgi:hypothetical protein